MSDYWDVVEPVWDTINIYEGSDTFRETFFAAAEPARLLFAVHFCQSEICNGGFDQFFWNSTGVLAPEAVVGFREIGQFEIASLIETAMHLLGDPYPRDRNERQERLSEVPKGVFDTFDEKFFALIGSENGGFETAADNYVNRSGDSH